jgi:methyl-accepting chemotaxis protein
MELGERVAALEESNKSAHHRIGEVREQTTAIHQLASSVEHMAGEIRSLSKSMDERSKQMDERLNKQDDRLDEYDERLDQLVRTPGEQAIKAAKSLAYLVAAALIGYYIK